MKTPICIAAIALTAIETFAAIGGVTAQLVVGFNGSPTQAVIGSDGNLWFSDSIDHAIGKETVSQTTFTNGTGFYLATAMPAGKQPGAIPAITPGPDGALWFTWDDSANSVAGAGRLTTAGTMTLFPVANEVFAGTSIVAGPDGNLWFVNALQRSVVRVTPSGDATRFITSTTYTGPTTIVSGPDGNLWISEDGFIGSAAAIAKVTPSGGITDFALPNSASRVARMAAGPDGAVWFTDKGTNSIGRIAPDGTIAEYPIPSANSSPAGIVSAPDGNLWFIEANAFRIGRVTVTGAAPVIDEQPFSGHGTAQDLIVFQKPPGTSSRVAPEDNVTFRLIGNFTPANGGLCFVFFDVNTVVNVPQKADLTIKKTHDIDDFSVAADGTRRTSVTYRIEVHNSSDVDCGGGFTVRDPMPRLLTNPFVSLLGKRVSLVDGEQHLVGSATCSFEAFSYTISCDYVERLGARTSEFVVVGGDVEPSLVDTTRVDNQAVVSALCDGNSANNTTDVDSFEIDHGLLTVTKDQAKGLGDVLVWRITISNRGTFPTRSPIIVTDPIPPNVGVGDVRQVDKSIDCALLAGNILSCKVNRSLGPRESATIFVDTTSLPANATLVNVAGASDGSDRGVFSAPATVTTDAAGRSAKTGATLPVSPDPQPTHGRH